MPITAPRDFDLLNATINRLSWNGATLQVLRWSDSSHLLASLDELGD
jgi:probable phosphoglycerate mutase